LAIDEKPDVILCDITMPDTNGYQVIKELKDSPVTSAIPFIYVTASGEKSEIKRAVDMGAYGYIRKPFDPDKLVQLVTICVKE
jgi:CheY-like chemotaxis protein